MLGVGRERAQGVATETSPEGVKECDTFTCGHCQRIVFVRPKQSASDMGGLCKVCMTLICPRCTGAGFCLPFMKKLEAEEDLDRRLRSYGV